MVILFNNRRLKMLFTKKLIKLCTILFFISILTFLSSCTNSIPSLEEVNNPLLGKGPLALKESSFGTFKNMLEKRNEKIIKKDGFYFILNGKDKVNLYIFDYVESEKNILITCPSEKYSRNSDNIKDIFNFVVDNNKLLGSKIIEKFTTEYSKKPSGNFRIFDDLFIDYKVTNGLLYIIFYNPKETSNLIITDTESKISLKLPRSFSDIFKVKISNFKDNVCTSRTIQLNYSPSNNLDLNLVSIDYANISFKDYLITYYDGDIISQKNDKFLFLYLNTDLKKILDDKKIILSADDMEYYNTVVFPDLLKFENYIKWNEKKKEI